METTTLYDTLLSDYQVRKSKKQKLRFISFVEERCRELGLSCQVEKTSGLYRNRNIVVGDVSQARLILTAHYDTCALMPFPNFITPKNIVFFILYQFLLVGIIMGVAYAVAYCVTFFVNDAPFNLIRILTLFVCLWQMMGGFPNKHTANDNTSGVATLLALMHNLPVEDREKVAFVFFDNEEVGMLGSSAFKKSHKNDLRHQLLINFDCVSDGDTFLFVSKKSVLNGEEYPVFKTIMAEEAIAFDKKTDFSRASRAFYPSDQLLFPKSIAVSALKRAPVIGLYMDRIHTLGDTKFDRSNIDFLCSSFSKFITQLSYN